MAAYISQLWSYLLGNYNVHIGNAFSRCDVGCRNYNEGVTDSAKMYVRELDGCSIVRPQVYVWP